MGPSASGHQRGRPRPRRAARDPRHPEADEPATSTPAAGPRPLAQLTASHVSALQRTAGNQAVAQLLTVQREGTSLLTDYAAEHVNVIDAVHELRRAIDQTKVDDKDDTRKVDFPIVDRVLTNLAPSQIATIKTEYLKETDHELVEDLLGEKAFTEYRSAQPTLKPKALRHDGEGEATVRTGFVMTTLTDDQRARVRALLAGTALEPTGATAAAAAAGQVPTTEMSTALPGRHWETDASGKAHMAFTPDAVETEKIKSLPDPGAAPGTLSDAAKVIRRNRAAADAAELKMLLAAEDQPSTQGIMQVLRKTAADGDWISGMYRSQFNTELEPELAGLNPRKLLGIGFSDGDRALALRYGDWNRADAIALLGMARAIHALDEAVGSDRMRAAEMVRSLSPGAKIPVIGPFVAQRHQLQVQMERLLAQIGSEAAAETGGGPAAMTVRLQALMEINISADPVPKVSLGRALGVLLPAGDLSVVQAVVGGDPVAEAAARLSRADVGEMLDPKVTADVLRGLRTRAEAEVRQEAREETEKLKATGIPAEQVVAALDLIQQKATQEVGVRAQRYITEVITRFDQLGEARGPGHEHFAALVDAWKNQRDQTLVGHLVAEGGKARPIDELQFAMGGDPPDLLGAASILRALPVPARRAVVAEYDARAQGTAAPTLQDQVAGAPISRGAARGPGVVQTGERARRTDQEAAVAELINAPEPGGESELSWTFKWTRDTHERALAEGGMAGRIGDTTIGGVREVREILDDSENQLLDAMNEFRTATSSDAKVAALLKARDARAAMSVDKNAYVAATDALRASIANAVAIAVDIALTFAVPGAGGVLAGVVRTLAVNIGTKVAILGDQYSSDMLTGDIVGAVVGLGLGAPSKLAGEGAAKIVGRTLAAEAGTLGYALSPELKAFAASATRLSGATAETAVTTVGTNLALGHDATQGMGLAFVVAGVKLHMVPVAKVAGQVPEPSPDPDGPRGGSARAATPDDDAVEVDEADIIEETPMALPDSDTAVTAVRVPKPRRPVGTSMAVGDDVTAAWRLYQLWRSDDVSREVALIYNLAKKRWAVVQGSAAEVDTIAAAKAMGWEIKDTMTLGRHVHPPGRSGVTEAGDLQPSGRHRDLDMVRGDAHRADSGDGVHWSAIDVTTQHGNDTVYVFYDRRSGVYTVRSPDPGAGPGQYEWNSFADVAYFHVWYKSRFGSEPSPVTLYGDEGGGGLPTQAPRAGGAGPAPTTPDTVDAGGTTTRAHSDSTYTASEDFGDVSKTGNPEVRYFVRAELEDGVMSADFMLRRMDVAGQEGEFHRSTLRGAQEFKAALDHFRRQSPDAVREIKGEWGAGDNLDGFNESFLKSKRAGKSDAEAIDVAAADTTTARWARDNGFGTVEVMTTTWDPGSGLFDHVEVRFRP